MILLLYVIYTIHRVESWLWLISSKRKVYNAWNHPQNANSETEADHANFSEITPSRLEMTVWPNGRDLCSTESAFGLYVRLLVCPLCNAVGSLWHYAHGILIYTTLPSPLTGDLPIMPLRWLELGFTSSKLLYPALNLIPTLNHPSAPQQQVLNHAKSASGGNSTPWNIGVASGYGLLGVDLGNNSGRWVWRAERIVVVLPGC